MLSAIQTGIRTMLESLATQLPLSDDNSNNSEASPGDIESAVTFTHAPQPQRTGPAPPLSPTLARHSFPRQGRPPYQPTRVMYRKEVEVRICPALRDPVVKNGAAPHSQRLLADPHEVQSTERGQDARDTVLEFRSIISEMNLVTDDQEQRLDNAPVLIDGGNRIVLLELALVVHDPLWAGGNVYLRAELDQVAPLQRSTHTIGDQAGIARRYSAASTSSQTGGSEGVAGASCPNNKLGATVAGWCMQCGLVPTATTLYQAPLSDDQVVHYSEEMLASLGTHEHITRVGVGQDALEVSSVSTLARDIYDIHGGDSAVVAIAGSDVDETLFVNTDVWRRHVDSSRKLVLNNLPLTDLTAARLRLAARGTPECVERTIRVVLAAQCIEFVRT